MLLNLRLPQFALDVRGGTIAHWHVREGDEVGFGDDLFDLKVSERIMMLRHRDAATVVGLGDAEPAYHVKPTEMYFRVLSADPGVVRKVIVAEGEHLAVGGVAAVVSTERDESLEGDPSDSLPDMRVAVNHHDDGADW